MFRQSPRRNGRNKGIKIKHVLQISVLLGVSIWLLYQVQHSHNKKSSITANISEKLQNNSDNDMIKLGRKDLRPKVKEISNQDRKETEERQADEEGVDENEPEELVQDHESEEGEDAKHEEAGENENADGGEESQEKENGIAKTNEMENEHEQIKVEMKGIEQVEVKERGSGGKGGEQSGVKNIKTKEKSKTEGARHNKHERKHGEHGVRKHDATKEENREKMREKEQENTKNNEQVDAKKESAHLGGKKSKHEEEGSKKEMKELWKTDLKEEGDEKESEGEGETKDAKQSDHGGEIKGKLNENKSDEQNKVVVVEKTEKEDGNKTGQNPKELEFSVPSEDHEQSASSELVNDPQNTRREKNGERRGQNETGEEKTSSSKETNVDQAVLGLNTSRSETNKLNNALNVSSMAANASVKDEQGDGTSATSDQTQNEKVGNLSKPTESEKTTVHIKSNGTPSDTSMAKDKSIQKESNAQTEINNKEMSLVSYPVPLLEPETAKLMNGNSADSVSSTGNANNGKVQEQEADGDSGAQDNVPSSSNKSENDTGFEQSDDSSSSVQIPQEEKDARTDLGTLPESGTGGSSSHENAAAE